LKEEALDLTVWKTGVGRGYVAVLIASVGILLAAPQARELLAWKL